MMKVAPHCLLWYHALTHKGEGEKRWLLLAFSPFCNLASITHLGTHSTRASVDAFYSSEEMHKQLKGHLAQM